MGLEWLDEIERRANAATPGPWGRNKHGDIGAGQFFTNPVLIHIDGWEECTDADLEFIAAAREDVPKLCRAVRELVSALKSLDAHLDFGEPLAPGEWGIADPSGVNAAFREAVETLERWERGGA